MADSDGKRKGRVWFELQGGYPAVVELAADQVVYELQDAIFAKLAPLLKRFGVVVAAQLRVYLEEGGRLLQFTDVIPQHKLDPRGRCIPFYVTYDDMEPACKRQRTALPAVSTPVLQLQVPELQKLEAGTLLQVTGFQEFLAPNTDAAKPLFIRKHLVDVHDAAVNVLKEKGGKRLVSLVGCPGIGKTWCGLLVAHTLLQLGVRTVHLTIRGLLVSLVVGLSTRSIYRVEQWSSFMLEQVLEESKCKVCILDVGELPQLAVANIFLGVQALLEDGRWFEIKFFCMASGHAEELITGKAINILEITKTLVLWSWTKSEFEQLCKAMTNGGHDAPPPEAYAICGGSVRCLFKLDVDKDYIEKAIVRLSQAEMKNFLKLDMPASDDGHRQLSRLLSFRPKGGRSEDVFRKGVSQADILPRSDYVIRCIRENSHTEFNDVANMFQTLQPKNTGAAGTAFELLVHMFWKEKIGRSADHRTVELTLRKNPDTKKADATIKVDCSALIYGSVEEWEDGEGDAPIGYFVPDNSCCPVLDSILRFELNGKRRALAIQVSIAQSHRHSDHNHRLLNSDFKEKKKQLALWDFRTGGKQCKWDPVDSDVWDLTYVSCEEFEQKLRKAGLCDQS